MEQADGTGSVLLLGASRGLGHGLAVELAARGWHVTGTARTASGTPLHELAARQPDRVAAAMLDITDGAAITALRQHLEGRRFDILFVNAGTTNPDPDQPVGQVATEEFVEVMLTNALGAMRAVERLGELVRPGGLVGVMSSGQGSIGNNTRGGREVYRASKAALNQLMRSYAARQADPGRAMLLLAPGWIRTELGGPDAPFTLADSIPKITDVLLSQRGVPGLRYLDRDGRPVPW